MDFTQQSTQRWLEGLHTAGERGGPSSIKNLVVEIR